VLLEMLGFDPDKDDVYNDSGTVSQFTLNPEQCMEIMEKAVRHGTLLTYKQTFRRKDGTKIDTELQVRAACHADATVAYLEGFVRPDTAENEIIRTLIENEKLYKSIFEITGAGTIIIENDMTISLTNAGFERISGFSKAELEGKRPWPDLIAFDGFIYTCSREYRRLRETPRDRYRLGDIVGKSEPMQKVYELILRAAATSANVIIYGESGTGKKLAASAIHKLSERAGNRFIPVNCGAIPSELLESEFFGYRKGAFTGADKDKPGVLDLAENGSLFLDELTEISTGMQAKLLRAIEGGGYTPVGGSRLRKPDVRIIAATNGNLRKLVESGAMREDFFYRIHIIPIYIPPLRERKEDIPLLVEHFMDRLYSARSAQPHTVGSRVKALPGHVLDSLMNHHWPGNIRELENTLQRFVDLGHIDFADCLPQSPSREETLAPMVSDSTETLRDAVARFERNYLLQVLEQHRWNRSKAAEMLGVERKTLYLKLKKTGHRIAAPVCRHTGKQAICAGYRHFFMTVPGRIVYNNDRKRFSPCYPRFMCDQKLIHS